MKMQKKALQIETNFLDEDEQSPKIVTSLQTNYEQKIQSATLFEKSLSNILARNFIQCWKQLKNNESVPRKTRKICRTVSKKLDKNSNYILQEKCHSSSIQNYKTKPRSESQPFINLKTERSLYGQDDEYRIKRNKSTRVINQQIENSRATILKDIVEKLKNSKKIAMQEQYDETNLEVYKRIAHLERMVKNIKNTARNDNSKSTSYLGFDTSRTYYKNRQINFQPLPSAEEEELVKQFLDQIQIIRKQITEIKNNNELILKAEMQRSQVSQHSSRRNRSIPNTQSQAKAMLTEGVQTIERQPALAELEQKIKKLAEEASMFSKATPITHGNGSYLGASGTQSLQSEKYLLNQSYKNSSTNQNAMYSVKANPLVPVTQNQQFAETSINSNGILFRPSNITLSLTPCQPQTYTFPQSSSAMNFNRTLLYPPSTTTIITKPNIHFEYPKFDHTKMTTFENRSSIVDTVPIMSTISRGFSQPSSFIHPKNSNVYEESKKNITFTNYCSSCGRSCACPKTIITQNRRF